MIGKGIKLCMCAVIVIMGVEAVSRYGAAGGLLIVAGVVGGLLVVSGKA